MTVALLALGSNLGDRAAHLHAAVAELSATDGVRVLAVSSFHETAPVGGPGGQGAYLNAAASVETSHDPVTLLKLLLAIELWLGRVRSVKDAPRTIDLDLLLYGDLIRTEGDPLVPHPRMHERSFVLGPLAEIAPEVVHPGLLRTVQQMLDDLAAPRDRLTGLRTLVTGSTSGIGRAIAIAFAEAGADVIVHGRRSLDAAKELAGAIADRGRRCHTILADVGNTLACRYLVETAWQKWAGIDVWVNNAGADVLTGEAGRRSFDRKLDELLDVDLRATIRLSRSVGERMVQRGGGTIINIGWDQAEIGMAGDSGQLFAATKAAVMAFSKSLALSLAPAVRVNVIAPGWIRTAWGESASEAWQARVLTETPAGRWGTPEDVAAAAVWLASPAAAFVTGQVLRVNGGAVR